MKLAKHDSPYTEEFVERLARQACATGQASFPIDVEKTALLVIDMQVEFVQPGLSPGWVPAATEIIPRVAAILNAARQAERPVIHTAFAATHLGYDRPAPGAFMPNRYPGYSSPAHRAEPRFVEDLQPAENEIVLLKPSYGAFYDTPLDTILHNLGCDTLVITGTLTNLCCGMTARQAYERGYKVLFAADATATTLPELQEAELQTLRYGFARIMNAQEIVCMFAERYA